MILKQLAASTVALCCLACVTPDRNDGIRFRTLIRVPGIEVQECNYLAGTNVFKATLVNGSDLRNFVEKINVEFGSNRRSFGTRTALRERILSPGEVIDVRVEGPPGAPLSTEILIVVL